MTVPNMMEIVIIRIKAMMGGLQLQFFTSIKCKRLFQSHSFLLKFDGKVDTAISVSYFYSVFPCNICRAL